MRLLNRYVLGAFGRIFSLSLAAFTGVYLLVDFFEKLDQFIEHHAAVSLYFLYFINKIPLVTAQVVPLAVLMAAFLTLGGFSRAHELTAMRAGGISLLNVTLPLLGVSALIALAVLAANEYLLPVSAKKVNYILRTEVKGNPDLVVSRDRLWLREGNAIINIRLASPEKGRLQGISVFEIDESFQLRARTDAAQASWSPAGWALEDGTIREFAPGSAEVASLESFRERMSRLEKSPEDFKVPGKKNDELGFRELRTFAAKRHQEGYDVTRLRVDLHSRLALPFANVIMAFLGIPFALQKGRSASLSVGVALTVIVGIAYHIIQAMLMAFGYSGVIPPLLAAWSAHLLFGFLALWLLLSARE